MRERAISFALSPRDASVILIWPGTLQKSRWDKTENCPVCIVISNGSREDDKNWTTRMTDGPFT
jgi:hypothetical protein